MARFPRLPSAIAPVLASALLFAGCITPSVLDESDRAVETPLGSLAWSPARAQDFHGLFESVAIEGDAAAGMARILYYFDASGSYSGAALLLGGASPEFRALSGHWSFGPSGLDLGDGSPLRAGVSGDYLRLSSAEGTAILRRTPLQ